MPVLVPTIGLFPIIDLEKTAVFKWLDALGFYRKSDDGKYYIGLLPGLNSYHSVVVSPIPSAMGPVEIQKPIIELKSKYPSLKRMILLGVAGGYRPEVKRHDVVIPSRIFNLDAVPKGEGDRLPEEEPITGTLQNKANNVFSKSSPDAKQWRSYFYNFIGMLDEKDQLFLKDVPLPSVLPNVNSAMVAGKNKDRQFSDLWFKKARIVAYGMEEFTFAKEARQLGCEPLVIRGICDYAELVDITVDGDKANQPISALVATAALGYLLSTLEGDLDIFSQTAMDIAPLSYQDFQKKIEKRKWVTGATNWDEDLHFSSYYLRNSSKKYLPQELKWCGYEEIVATYTHYNTFYEVYYINEEEAINVSKAIISRMLNDPQWFEQILERINDSCRSLQNDVFVSFNPNDSSEDDIFAQKIDSMSREEVLKLYEIHNDVHNQLYKYARIPEALDRGRTTFSNFLYSYLKERTAKVNGNPESSEKLNDIFNILTGSDLEPDEFTRKDLELNDIRKALNLSNSLDSKSDSNNPAANMLIDLDPNIIDPIGISYINKYRYATYHGYFDRAVTDLKSFINEISGNASFTEGTKEFASRIELEQKKRENLFDRYKIEPQYRRMFRFYARIRRVKAFRRWVQLRNFYFLDRLIRRISKLTHSNERTIRQLLPEEVIRFLKGEYLDSQAIGNQTFQIFYILKQNEGTFRGEYYKDVIEKLRSRRSTLGPVLNGWTINGGLVKGVARVINRRPDVAESGFMDGDIIVSEKINPDFYQIMNRASAVITQEGGVGSHVSFFSTEYKKPLMIDVADLSSTVRNGDFIIFDGNNRTVTIVKPPEHTKIVDMREIRHISSQRLGTKAKNLSILFDNGFDVPSFFVVPLERYLEPPTILAQDSESEIIVSLQEDVVYGLNKLGGQLYSVRSSMLTEDKKGSMRAGEYVTFVDVEQEDVPSVLTKLFKTIRAKKKPISEGSIIIQEMMLGDISGVTLTTYASDPNKMMIEMYRGGAESITSNVVTPVRLICNKNTKEFDRVAPTFPYNWEGELISSKLISEAVKKFTNIEKLFEGYPQSIEWTYKNGKFWILQSRDISNTQDQANEKSLDKFDIKLDTVPLVYSKYRVPLLTRKHMYRCAALASYICDHWKGDLGKINKNNLIIALLLHDVANIVKIDFKATYDELERNSIHYWLSVKDLMEKDYGKDDHEAVALICEEIGISKDIIELIRQKEFRKNRETYESRNFTRMVAAYCDQRISPNGLMSLEDRLKDARVRREGDKSASVNQEDYEEMKAYILKVEREIQKNVDIDLSEINDTEIEKYIVNMREINLLQQ